MENQNAILSGLLPFWKSIGEETRNELVQKAELVHFSKGQSLHAGQGECSGLFLIQSGRIRAYSITKEGKEITLFRLLDRDMCIFSASCMMKNISFDIYISAETEVDAIRIPTEVYEACSEKEISMTRFMNEILSSRMSDVMWILEQILFMSVDKRLASFLIEQAQLEESDTLMITHEQIANHLGSAREVVSRMLRYFTKEGLVEVKRGRVILTDKKNLIKLASSE